MMKASPMAVYRDEEDLGAVLFNVETGESFGLNTVAKVIWESVSAGLDREGIFSVLQQEFSGVPESARDDIDEMLKILQDKGFLKEQP